MKNTMSAISPKRREGRILIVDDDADMALSLVDILESCGYEVEIAHSAQGGREKAKAFDAQVALLDIHLGHESGIDLIAQLKQVCPEILCVMITAFATMDTAIGAVQKGAYDYLQKPLDVRHLLATLNRCFEKLQLENEKAAAEKALRARNAELAQLNRMGRELNTMLERQQVAERSLLAVTEIIGAEGASLWLWDEVEVKVKGKTGVEIEARDELVCWVCFHHSEKRPPVDLRLRPGEGVVGWVAQSGESAIVSHAPDDTRFFAGADEQSDFHTDSLLAAPLWVRGKIIGALEIVNKLEGDFDASDLALVETLAASAATAIDNARLIEVLRQYTTELEKRNEDLDAFAHTAAHDIKGPLGHMVGFAEALEESYAALSDEEMRRHLRTIARSGRKMSNIVDELLLLSSVRHLEKVKRGPLDMPSIVAEAQKRLGDLIEGYQTEIITPPPETWPVALGHGPWVEEIWVNYLSNALKYGGNPPRVELGFDFNSVDGGQWLVASDRSPLATSHSPLVRFWVRDNGPGLVAEEQKRLFRSYERLDRMRAKGHGLGLSIVRRIVDKLGGQVGVESKVGKGSSFWFTLPAQPQN